MDKIDNKIKGTLFGMALGDAMGMPSELWGKNKVKEYFGEIKEFLDGPKENIVACNYTKGQFTDDTGQALVIIDALYESNFKPNQKLIGEKLLEWAKKENAFEQNILGPTSKVALEGIRNNKDVKEFTDKALTNGSAMRISPIGCLFKPDQKEELAKYVSDISSVTHSSDVGIAGASIIAMAISSAIHNESFDKIIQDVYEIEDISRKLGKETFSPSFQKRIKLGLDIANKYKGNDKEFLNEIYDVVGAGVGIIESVPAAIAIAYYAQDPNKSALLCANLAGDTDTIGAMATAICGAYVGYDNIKEEYITILNKNNKEDLEDYFNKLKEGSSKLWKH